MKEAAVKPDVDKQSFKSEFEALQKINNNSKQLPIIFSSALFLLTSLKNITGLRNGVRTNLEEPRCNESICESYIEKKMSKAHIKPL